MFSLSFSRDIVLDLVRFLRQAQHCLLSKGSPGLPGTQAGPLIFPPRWGQGL